MSNLEVVASNIDVVQEDVFEQLERCRGWIESALAYSGGTHDCIGRHLRGQVFYFSFTDSEAK